MSVATPPSCSTIGIPAHTCSGGGGASGPTNDITPEVVDLTSGWTLLDPDGLIDTSYGTNGATFNAATGETTIKMNELASGDAKYMPDVATNGHHWPRWYRATSATNLSTCVMSVDLKNNTTPTPWARTVVVGMANDPTSTDVNVMDGTGAIFRHAGSVSNPFQYGVWTVSAATAGSNSTIARGLTTVMRSNDSLGSGTYITAKSDDSVFNSGSRNSNQNAAVGSSTPAFHIIGVGTYTTGTIAAGSLLTLRITQTTSIISFGA